MQKTLVLTLAGLTAFALGAACDRTSGSAPQTGRCAAAPARLVAGDLEIGSVSARQEGDAICVDFAATGDWVLTGTEVAISRDRAGLQPRAGAGLPHQRTGLWIAADRLCVPLAELGAGPDDPLYVAAHASVTRWTDASLAGRDAWALGDGGAFTNPVLELARDECPCECEGTSSSGGDATTGDDERVCGYRTQTQGGWGTKCNGDNPGCFRDAHFAEVFPAGLQVGCEDGRTATLLNSLAVEVALPTGGQPRALLASEAVTYDGVGDPKVGTVLFGQVVALSLSVAFDALPDYKQFDTPVPLADLVIVDPASPCVGLTVGAVLEAANLALGGCEGPLTAAQANACVTAINEAFVDGKTDAGAEICDDGFEPGDGDGTTGDGTTGHDCPHTTGDGCDTACPIPG